MAHTRRTVTGTASVGRGWGGGYRCEVHGAGEDTGQGAAPRETINWLNGRMHDNEELMVRLQWSTIMAMTLKRKCSHNVNCTSITYLAYLYYLTYLYFKK